VGRTQARFLSPLLRSDFEPSENADEHELWDQLRELTKEVTSFFEEAPHILVSA
jgi:hypothetical protein